MRGPGRKLQMLREFHLLQALPVYFLQWIPFVAAQLMLLLDQG